MEEGKIEMWVKGKREESGPLQKNGEGRKGGWRGKLRGRA